MSKSWFDRAEQTVQAAVDEAAYQLHTEAAMSSVEYECGTCGSRNLIVQAIAGRPFEVLCSNGHPWVPNPSQDVVFILTDDGDLRARQSALRNGQAGD